MSDDVKHDSDQQGTSVCCKGLAPLSECKCERENYATLLAERDALRGALERIDLILDFGSPWENPAFIEGGTDGIDKAFEQARAALDRTAPVARHEQKDAAP